MSYYPDMQKGNLAFGQRLMSTERSEKKRWLSRVFR